MRRTTALRRAATAVTVALALTAGLAVLAVAPPARAGTGSVTDTTLTNPSASGTLGSLTMHRLAERGSVTAFLYYQSWGSRPWAAFQDEATGATSHVSLSATSVAMNEWQDASVTVTGDGRLVVLSGSGPVHVREFELAGAPLPSSATLVRSRTLGDSDSRPGDLVMLASGALTAVWHQQGDAGPQGYGIAYQARAGASWAHVDVPGFMPSYASKQVAVQHPADGSVWVFSSPDAWGRIGAIHLTEGTGDLAIDWTDGELLSPDDGIAAPDPENPWLTVAADPVTGTIALAYQSRDRRIFSTAPVVTGSKPVVTRIAADGGTTAVVLPFFVERVSSMALAINGRSTSLAYRPVDEVTLEFDELHLSRHDGTAWEPSTVLGQLGGPYERVVGATSDQTVVARMADGRFHAFRAHDGGTDASTSTTSTTLASTTTSTTSTTAAPAPTSSKTCKSRRCR